MEKEITSVLGYFSFFKYYPNFDEIYTFLSKKTSKTALKRALLNLERQNKIKKVILNENDIKYTLVEYSSPSLVIPRSKATRDLAKRVLISKNKLKNWKFKAYVKLISLFPQIRLIGLSGSISMMNADLDDDIDLFIITSKNRLFTSRFLALLTAYIIGLKRGIGQYKAPNKVCLNLFFDESNLQVPKRKMTEFVGHEVLQMKPIVIKGDIYEKFLEANSWVFRLFPNAALVFSIKYPVSSIKKILNTKCFILDTVGDWIESKLKKLQLQLINKHKTTELITDSQLWFHPDDFEKKLTKKFTSP
ncbi:MAG: hypothetical protein UR89_C0031G0007 [Candidatus Roizmanbacteria bacterium GW2011_GWA2_35_8]|uniref:Polymerase nucleotidyl transferase domain-containing protein n=1 Tax=Candidatus Roizmanbacteria bacterium GW2011_GWA2_35_8 TaxID=1618479 RepID=A0A0G0CWC4_9BACT|nr:MAG: hypothetical protein UR89_C0031G0007 [Candidatus Roizmanbacteria bacterium GW2011_GWA2_35_8]